MSLIGLDDPKIAEAHEAAAAEPGSWLLLTYSDRHEVQLLGRGSGGLVELRTTVSADDEANPLYGFLNYRRKLVIIKYLPESCSRLIQARVAVHFSAVCERFSPHDFTFEIASVSELKDSKLSALCFRHTVSSSASSEASSLRRRRLVEIAEEEEDEQRSPKRQSTQQPLHHRPVSAAGRDNPSWDPTKRDSDLASSSHGNNFFTSSTSELPKFVGVDDQPSLSGNTSDAIANQLRTSQELFNPAFSSSSHSKPKVKLGPRPTLDFSTRPRTAGNVRPVSAIPAGLKLFGKNRKKTKAKDGPPLSPPPQTSHLDLASTSFLLSSDELQQPPREYTRPATSCGFTTGPSDLLAPPPKLDKQVISPEKARLMKAMELREKKKMMDNTKVSTAPAITQPSQSAAAPLGGESTPSIKNLKGATTSGNDDHSRTRPSLDSEGERRRSAPGASLATPSSFLHTDQTSDLTQPESRPISPVVASSDAGQSTKASSLSESTDETIQAKNEAPSRRLRKKEPPLPSSPESESTGEERDTSPDSGLLAAQARPELSAVLEAIQVKEDDKAEEEPPEEAVQRRDNGQDDDDSSPTSPALVTPQAESFGEAVSDQEPSLAPEASVYLNYAACNIETGSPTDGDGCQQKAAISLPLSKFSAKFISTSPRRAVEATDRGETTKPLRPELAESPTASNRTLRPATAASRPKTHIFDFSTQGSPELTKTFTRRGSAAGSARSMASKEKPELPPGSFSATERTRAQLGADKEATPTLSERRKRVGLMEMIRTELNRHSRRASRSNADFSDDDELMEELQSATVQEATPMLVAKTPMSATFPHSSLHRPSDPSAYTVRTVSFPDRRASLVSMDAWKTSSSRPASSGSANRKSSLPHLPHQGKPRRQSSQPLPVEQQQQRRRRRWQQRMDEKEEQEEEEEEEDEEDGHYKQGAKTKAEEEQRGDGDDKDQLPPLPSSPPPPPPPPKNEQRREWQQPGGGPLAKKSNLGSSISQRIKALEKLSAASGAAAAAAAISQARPSSSSFFSTKKRTPAASPRVADWDKSSHAPTLAPLATLSPLETDKKTELERSGSVAKRLSVFEPPATSLEAASPSSAGPGQRLRPESVSVTAKIVRDPSSSGPGGGLDMSHSLSSLGRRLDLRQSTLLVDHHMAAAEPLQEATGQTQNLGSASREGEVPGGGGSSSSSSKWQHSQSSGLVKDLMKERRKSAQSAPGDMLAEPAAKGPRSPSRPPSLHLSRPFSPRLSLSSRRSSISRERENLVSPTGDAGSVSGDDTRSSGSDQKLSRAGRFIRRLSTLSGPRGKTTPRGISPMVKEEEPPEATTPTATSSTTTTKTAPATATAVDLGDVNVQFPDSLLWKRRKLGLDEHGFLVLSSLQAQSGRPPQASQRYHLGQFQTPYAPDVEVQEMPNSVVLDFVDGPAIQVACGGHQGQMLLLRRLRDAHALYGSSSPS